MMTTAASHPHFGLLLTLGCQCNSLNPPGRNRTNVAAIVFATGKFVESTLNTTPPPPATFSAGFCSIRYTQLAGVPSANAVPPVTVAGSTAVPFMMKGLGDGVESKTDASTPKFLARMFLGVWVIQSSMLNVVPARSKSGSSKLRVEHVS